MSCIEHCIVRSGTFIGAGANFSVECEGCQLWFHGLCVGLIRLEEVPDTWRCPQCIASNVPVVSLPVSSSSSSSSTLVVPNGWTTETIIGTAASNLNQSILVYVSPDGSKCCDSIPSIHTYLKEMNKQKIKKQKDKAKKAKKNNNSSTSSSSKSSRSPKRKGRNKTVSSSSSSSTSNSSTSNSSTSSNSSNKKPKFNDYEQLVLSSSDSGDDDSEGDY